MKMRNTRRGLGKGLGTGYKNLAPMDSHIHSLSAKGVKSSCSRLNAKLTKKQIYDIIDRGDEYLLKEEVIKNIKKTGLVSVEKETKYETVLSIDGTTYIIKIYEE